MKTYSYLTEVSNKLLWDPYLKAIRNGLTLTLPLVMAGSVAVLISNFPLHHYQQFMFETFGPGWRSLSGYIASGTFSILSIIMLLTISFSLAEYHNTQNRNKDMHPAVAALVSLACLVIIIQPWPLAASVTNQMKPGETGIPFYWLGIHGLFVSIIIAFASTLIFLRLKRIAWLNISFYSEEADVSISYAFSAMIPGMLTIIIIAGFKLLTVQLGIDNLHIFIQSLLSRPFVEMGNSFGTAIFYTFLRHFFWFFGIHGSNLLEPITSSIYVPAMNENIAAVAAGKAAPHIFTKTFFDAYLSMGGSGATLCLLLAIFITNRRGSMMKISLISLPPAIFNINEMIIFGLPIVLNPIFIIPFLLVPIVLCVVSYLAISSGLVPPTIHAIDWTAPALIGGYAATGSYAGAALQLFNIILGAAIYMPFIRIANSVKKETFNRAYKELMPGYAESIGKSDYVITSEAMALSRSLTNDLAAAINRKELFLEYQPQVDSLTGKVFGVEALMRWNHSHLGRIPPGLFITLAEESGLIQDIGSWALEKACRQSAVWRKSGIDGITMSVNLSIHQLDDTRVVDEVKELITLYDIPQGALEVEVTESTALGGGGTGRSEVLQQIHDLGVSLAIDDFGMGHSSLVYLKHFPVDTLKIDRVLSKDVAVSRHSSEIISTIVELCRSLDIHILVEFVDNQEQLKALCGLGCYRIQGFLYSASLSAKKCEEFIRKGAPIYM